jgi:hypothetical protein
MRRIFLVILILSLTCQPVRGKTIKWVDFQVPYESLKYAMDADIQSFGEEKHLPWIQTLAVAGCRTGGKCQLSSVKKAVADLKTDRSAEELLGNLYEIISN